jgi:hypothetical protein
MEEKILKQLATKKDLEKLATKEELKAEVKKLATKDELKKIDQLLETTARQVVKNGETIQRVSLVTIDTAAKIEKLATKEEMNEKFSKVFDGQDKIIEKLDKQELERKAAIHREARVDKEIKNIKEHLALA